MLKVVGRLACGLLRCGHAAEMRGSHLHLPRQSPTAAHAYLLPRKSYPHSTDGSKIRNQKSGDNAIGHLGAQGPLGCASCPVASLGGGFYVDVSKVATSAKKTIKQWLKPPLPAQCIVSYCGFIVSMLHLILRLCWYSYRESFI